MGECSAELIFGVEIHRKDADKFAQKLEDMEEDVMIGRTIENVIDEKVTPELSLMGLPAVEYYHPYETESDYICIAGWGIGTNDGGVPAGKIIQPQVGWVESITKALEVLGIEGKKKEPEFHLIGHYS